MTYGLIFKSYNRVCLGWKTPTYSLHWTSNLTSTMGCPIFQLLVYYPLHKFNPTRTPNWDLCFPSWSVPRRRPHNNIFSPNTMLLLLPILILCLTVSKYYPTDLDPSLSSSRMFFEAPQQPKGSMLQVIPSMANTHQQQWRSPVTLTTPPPPPKKIPSEHCSWIFDCTKSPPSGSPRPQWPCFKYDAVLAVQHC